MKIDLDSSEFMKYVTEELNMIPRILNEQKLPMLRKVGNIIKKNVEESLPRTDIKSTKTNYDGTPYTHMRDDVKATVIDDKMGNSFALVRGGKMTAYKWHLADNGTSDTPALHFVDKAMKKSEKEINDVISIVISKAVRYER